MKDRSLSFLKTKKKNEIKFDLSKIVSKPLWCQKEKKKSIWKNLFKPRMTPSQKREKKIPFHFLISNSIISSYL